MCSGRISMRQIIHAMNCPCDELSMRRIVLRRIVRDELSVTNGLATNHPSAQTSVACST